METNFESQHRELLLFDRGQKATPSICLLGRSMLDVITLAMENTVHLHAISAMTTEVLRNNIVWHKGEKTATRDLTPRWVEPMVNEVVQSILILGYVGYRFNEKVGQIIIAPLGLLNIVCIGGEWKLEKQQAKRWKLIMYKNPLVIPPCTVKCVSSAARAEGDTLIYNEIYENSRRRDFFNSRPSCFTTVDKKLQNQNGSVKQWFQQATAADAVANRPVQVDRNFQTLVSQRAESIKALGKQSTMDRERLTKTRLAGAKSDLEDEVTNAVHEEYIVTDGREVHGTRNLMSLTDGYQLQQQAVHNIFHHYNVPPQVMGKNINAERTGVNPRLNEVVLDSFTATATNVQDIITVILQEFVVKGSVLKFKTALTPTQLAAIHPFIRDDAKPGMYAATYKVAEPLMDKVALGESREGPEIKKTKLIDRHGKEFKDY